MSIGRIYSTLNVLSSGRVLAAAGYSDEYGVQTLATAETYNPVGGT